jgi:hypothetical protein
VRIGKTVYLVPLLISAPFDSDYADLVNHDLIPPGAKLESVKTANFTLSKNAQGKWQLSHKPGNAAPSAAAALASAWSKASGEWLTALKKQAKGKKPLAEAQVTLHNGKTIHYQELKNNGQLLLTRKDLGVAYHIPDNEGARLFKIPRKKKTDKPRAKTTATAH